MSGLVLGYTTRNIVKWERSHGGVDFKSLLENPCDTNIIELIKIGNNSCTDDEAFDKLDAYLEENESNTVYSAIMEIIEHLANAKRVPKSKVEEMKQGLAELL